MRTSMRLFWCDSEPHRCPRPISIHINIWWESSGLRVFCSTRLFCCDYSVWSKSFPQAKIQMTSENDESRRYLRVRKAPPIYSSVAESNAYFRQLGRCLAAVTFVQAHEKLSKQTLGPVKILTTQKHSNRYEGIISVVHHLSTLPNASQTL